MKYTQKVTLKTQFFGHLHLKLKDTCARSKHKPKNEHKDRGALGQWGDVLCAFPSLHILGKVHEECQSTAIHYISTSSQTAEGEVLPLSISFTIANLCFHLLPCIVYS